MCNTFARKQTNWKRIARVEGREENLAKSKGGTAKVSTLCDPKDDEEVGPSCCKEKRGFSRKEKEGGQIKDEKSIQAERKGIRTRGRLCVSPRSNRAREGPVWLTDDLIKRGTNYRPAGC